MIENQEETTRLFEFLLNFDNADLPDGAWQAALEDAIRSYNKAHQTYFDPFVAFLEYCNWMIDK